MEGTSNSSLRKRCMEAVFEVLREEGYVFDEEKTRRKMECRMEEKGGQLDPETKKYRFDNILK
jgi:hypothetical protein